MCDSFFASQATSHGRSSPSAAWTARSAPRAAPAPRRFFCKAGGALQRASSSTLRWLALSAGRRVLGAGQARELRAALGPPAPLVRHLRAAARGRHRRRQQALRGLPKEAAELWHAGRAEGALVRARAAPRADAANPRPPLRCHGCSQKHPGAENVVSKRCEECKNKQPSYGMPSDNKQRWCQPCSTKHPGAINLVGKKKGGQRGTTPPSPSSQNHPAEPNPPCVFFPASAAQAIPNPTPVPQPVGMAAGQSQAVAVVAESAPSLRRHPVPVPVEQPPEKRQVCLRPFPGQEIPFEFPFLVADKADGVGCGRSKLAGCRSRSRCSPRTPPRSAPPPTPLKIPPTKASKY